MREKIKQWIMEHEEEMLADLGRLVKYRSVSVMDQSKEKVFGEECAAVLEEFLAMGAEYGFEAKNEAYYCGTLRWENGGSTIGLYGHLDIVPDNGEWVYPPFECTRKGDFIIGRGVQDNKGPTIISLYAMRCIRDLGLPFGSSIQLFGGCAEETGMEDVEYFTANCKVPDYNIVGDAHFPVCYAEKGILGVDLVSGALSGNVLDFKGGTVTNIVPDCAEITLKMTPDTEAALSGLSEDISVSKESGKVRLSARGLAKHSAMPEGSLNAIHKLLCAVFGAGLLSEEDRDALDLIREVCSEFDGSPLNVKSSDFSGDLTCVGSVVRMERGKAVLSVNIRYPVTASFDEMKEKIAEKAGSKGYDAVNFEDSKPNHVDKNSHFVQALTNAYNQVTGDKAEPYVMGGGTYARKIPNAVAFGTGFPYDSSGLNLPEGHGSYHCPDESYSVEKLLKGLEVYIMSLLELDKVL